MEIENKKLILDDKSNFNLKKIHIGKYNKDECLIKIVNSSICSSDMNRVFNKGAYYYPIVLGHEFSGRVYNISKRNSDLYNLKVGDLVGVFPLIPCFKCTNCKKQYFNYCKNYLYYGSRNDGGFSTFLNVKAWNLIKIKGKINYNFTSLLEPIAVALESIKNIKIQNDSNILIVGAGFIGSVICKLLSNKINKSQLFILDRNKYKLNLLKNFSNTFVKNVNNLCNIKSLPKFDYIIDASSAPNTLGLFIENLNYNGRLIILSNHFEQNIITSSQTSLILRRNLHIKGSWNSEFKGKKLLWKKAINFIKKEDLFLQKITYGPINLNEVSYYFDCLNKKEKDEKYFNPHKIIINNEISS